MTHDPIRRLSEREGRRSPRGAPTQAVPDHLEHHLREWVDLNTTPDLERRIALLLEVTVRAQRDGRRSLAWNSDADLLEIADLVLQLDPQLQRDIAEFDQQAEDIRETEDAKATFHDVPEIAEELDGLLTDGNSTYRINRHVRPLRLVKVVDSTVAAAATRAIENAEQTAGDLLEQAWTAAYAVRPDPERAYHDSVRAVERAIAPIVSGTNPQPTLGTALRTLEGNPTDFELVLVDDQDAGEIDPAIALLRRLWQGHRSRHGGGRHARDQTLDEARAAVQLAVLCVGWLTDGALRPRSS